MSVYLLSHEDLDRLRELISSLAPADKQLKAVELASLIESLKTSGTKLAAENAALKPQLESSVSELQSLLDRDYSLQESLESFISSFLEVSDVVTEPEATTPSFEILPPGMPGSNNSPIIY